MERTHVSDGLHMRSERKGQEGAEVRTGLKKVHTKSGITKSSVRLYLHYIAIVLRSTMQYKTSFFLMVIGRFLLSFNGILGVYFMLSRFRHVKGYTFGEVLLCFSIIQMDFALAECISGGFAAFADIVRQGDFDRILLRPRSAILQVLGSQFRIDRIGLILQAIVMFVYGVAVSPVKWTFGRSLTVILMLFGGTTLFTSFFLLRAAFTFFTLEGIELVNILTYGAQEHGKYPIDIYGKKMLRFCTYIIPYTLVQYYPLQYLLGRTDRWYYGIYPLGAVGFLLICYAAWRFGMWHYQSAGS